MMGIDHTSHCILRPNARGKGPAPPTTMTLLRDAVGPRDFPRRRGADHAAAGTHRDGVKYRLAYPEFRMGTSMEIGLPYDAYDGGGGSTLPIILRQRPRAARSVQTGRPSRYGGLFPSYRARLVSRFFVADDLFARIPASSAPFPASTTASPQKPAARYAKLPSPTLIGARPSYTNSTIPFWRRAIRMGAPKRLTPMGHTYLQPGGRSRCNFRRIYIAHRNRKRLAILVFGSRRQIPLAGWGP